MSDDTMAEAPPKIDDTLRPIALSERIYALDVLRGLALFGILLVNMAYFSHPVDELMMTGQVWSTRLERFTDWIVRFLAEGKFYSLFALLFGMGAAIQMERAEARGLPFHGFYTRRLLVLLGIGLLHAFLVWEGDILVWYALFGFLLLLFRKRKPRTLLVWAGISLLILPAILWVVWGVIRLVTDSAEYNDLIASFAEQKNDYARQAEEQIRIFAHGTYSEIFLRRASNVMSTWAYGLTVTPVFFAMCLVGMYMGRRHLLQDLERNLHGLRRMCVWAVAVGIPANAVYATAMGPGEWPDMLTKWFIGATVMVIGAPAFCLLYFGVIAQLLQREEWTRRFRPVAAAGQLAFSNYLMQSIICTTIFYSYGLGLYGSIRHTDGIILAIVIYATQLAFSVWWLRRFKAGPLECLWRTLTYGRPTQLSMGR